MTVINHFQLVPEINRALKLHPLAQERPYKKLFKEFVVFMDALVALPESKRLAFIHQTIGAYGSAEFKRGGPLNTDRLLHSIQVAEVALLMSLRSGCSLTEIKLCLAVALMHDWGHTPFGHSGEEAAREQPGTRFFDHDLLSAVLASQPHVVTTLSEHGCDPREVVAALLGPGSLKDEHEIQWSLAELSALGLPSNLIVDLQTPADRTLIEAFQGFHTLVQDYCDMIAYVFQDFAQSINPQIPSAVQRGKRLASIKRKVTTSLRLEEQKLCCSDLNAFRKFLGIYIDYSSKFVLRPQSACAASAVRKVLKTIPGKDFVRATEPEVLAKLSPADRQSFSTGLDTQYRFIAAFRVSPRYQFRGRELELVTLVKEAIASIPNGAFSVSTTTSIIKQFVLSLEGNAIGQLNHELPRVRKRGGQWNKEHLRKQDSLNIYLSTLSESMIRVHLLNTPKIIIVSDQLRDDKDIHAARVNVIEAIINSSPCIVAGLLLDEEFHVTEK